MQFNDCFTAFSGGQRGKIHLLVAPFTSFKGSRRSRWKAIRTKTHLWNMNISKY